MARTVLLLSMAVSGLAGCTSFSTTGLSRLDDNSFIGESNGPPRGSGALRPHRGVPVTLAVTSHVDVYIEETYFLQTAPADAGDRLQLTEVPLSHPIRHVRAETIRTKKVFLVDLKRPASGVLDSAMEFNEDQYFDRIHGKATDTTIRDSTQLIATLISNLPTGRSVAKNAQSEYVRRTRAVAYRRFDLNAPDFEQQLDAFVSQHLSCVSPVCGDRRSVDSAPSATAVVTGPFAPQGAGLTAAPAPGFAPSTVQPGALPHLRVPAE